MTSCNHMGCHSWNGSQEQFFNKTMLDLKRQRVSQDCLCIVATIPWPARSPDLSPIEHIWVHLGRPNNPKDMLKKRRVSSSQALQEAKRDFFEGLNDP
ncbi:hypothetical protein TNCV_2182711 [Trichonephila clavipes]|uniref:Uncharacterized protein n=1 Tax=Trichonephila clavipes TaxID=2585209 RepID=A0A8X7B852_TRICX|nr:hypothetical protein TNCV_2182711 [Trichonephila clavipes]